MRICSIQDCGGRHEALGYCKLHYAHYKQHGDPLVGSLQNSGLSKTPEYKTWIAVRRRTRNPKHKDYSTYGGSGITMSDELYNSFELFYKTLGPKPSSKHSIDRENGRKGYEVGNIRWATKHQQASNRKNTSIIPGVNINGDGRKNKYHAELSMNGKRIFNKYFPTLDEAVQARKQAEQLYGI